MSNDDLEDIDFDSLTDMEKIEAAIDEITYHCDVEFAESVISEIDYSNLATINEMVSYQTLEDLIDEMKNELRQSSPIGVIESDWADTILHTLSHELEFFSLN